MKIAFLDYSTCLQTVRDLTSRARGGMVSSLFLVSDHLAAAGHDVTVLSDIAEEGDTPAGVKWRRNPVGRYRVLICNRGIGYGYPDFPADRRVLWTHDLPHDGFCLDVGAWRGIDRVVFLSDYAERVWRGMWAGIGKGVWIPNGVGTDLFRPIPYGDRREKHFIYASAPLKGLKRIPFIADCLAEIYPGATVTAYSNLSVMHPGEGDVTDHGDWTETCAELRDPLPQAEFAAVLQRCAGVLMPSDYPEICANVTLQALACGVPVFGTGGLGSIEEWVTHDWNGALTRFFPHDYSVYERDYLRSLKRYLTDPVHAERLRENAAKTPGILTWEEVGAEWERMLCTL